jgi:hypothetical protein
MARGRPFGLHPRDGAYSRLSRRLERCREQLTRSPERANRVASRPLALYIAWKPPRSHRAACHSLSTDSLPCTPAASSARAIWVTMRPSRPFPSEASSHLMRGREGYGRCAPRAGAGTLLPSKSAGRRWRAPSSNFVILECVYSPRTLDSRISPREPASFELERCCPGRWLRGDMGASFERAGASTGSSRS